METSRSKYTKPELGVMRKRDARYAASKDIQTDAARVKAEEEKSIRYRQMRTREGTIPVELTKQDFEVGLLPDEPITFEGAQRAVELPAGDEPIDVFSAQSIMVEQDKQALARARQLSDTAAGRSIPVIRGRLDSPPPRREVPIIVGTPESPPKKSKWYDQFLRQIGFRSKQERPK